MKYITTTFITILFLSCQNNAIVKERMIGFHPNQGAQDLGWHLGIQQAVDVVIALDQAWAANDFEKMKTLFVDTLTITISNGRVFKNFDDFKNYEQSQGSSNWEFLYAYSVDINPKIGGEHVQAGFLITNTEAYGTKVKKRVHESYFISQGKIVSLDQYEQKVLE